MCDIGKLSYYTIQKRILKINESKDLFKKNKKYGKEAKPFMTCSLGLYDLKSTLEMDFKQYKKFVAELFDIELKEKIISGYEFDGVKDGDYVKIFNYQKFTDSSIDEDYLYDIHDIVGDKIGDRVYIVAPLNRVDFITEYFEIDDVRYYFLKIPYEIIKELHQKPFQKYRQPKSLNNVNSLDEAIGFHFIRQPDVVSELLKVKDGYELIIKKFRSNELESVKNSEEKEMKQENYLASVFIDTDYDGKNFIMSKSVFADEMKTNEDGIVIPIKQTQKIANIGVIYTDIFGNDFMEVLKVKE